MKVSSSSHLFALRTLSSSAVVPAAGEPNAATTDNTLAEQVSAWREARLSQPSLTSSPKQAALDKAAILKRRLEMLKAMLLFASPEAAKSIASQLKKIAGELAALGKSLGGGAAAQVTPNVALAGGETAGETTSAAVASEPAEMPAEPTAAANTEQAAAAQVADDDADQDSAEDGTPAGESTQKSDDSALRKAIADAKRLLKELILRTKAKLQEGDAQARRDLQAAEKSLAELDSMSDAGLYSAAGGLDTAMAGAELSLTLTGASVDVSA